VLTASVVKAPAEVIKRIFDEAERRDPKRRRTWVALFDDANHEIEPIKPPQGSTSLLVSRRRKARERNVDTRRGLNAW